MRNKNVAQPVAAFATELIDHLGDIGNKTSSGTQLHDIGIHLPIIATKHITTVKWCAWRSLALAS